MLRYELYAVVVDVVADEVLKGLRRIGAAAYIASAFQVFLESFLHLPHWNRLLQIPDLLEPAMEVLLCSWQAAVSRSGKCEVADVDSAERLGGLEAAKLLGFGVGVAHIGIALGYVEGHSGYSLSFFSRDSISLGDIPQRQRVTCLDICLMKLQCPFASEQRKGW